MRDPISFGSPRFSGHWSRCNRRTSRHHQTSKSKARGTERTPGFLLFSVASTPARRRNRGLDWRTPLCRHRSLTIRFVVQDAAGERLHDGVYQHPFVDHAARPRLSYAGLAEWLRQRSSKPHTLGSIPTVRSMRQRTQSHSGRCLCRPKGCTAGCSDAWTTTVYSIFFMQWRSQAAALKCAIYVQTD